MYCQRQSKTAHIEGGAALRGVAGWFPRRWAAGILERVHEVAAGFASRSPADSSAVSHRATCAKSPTERLCSSCATASGQPVQLQFFRPRALLVKHDVALRRLVRHQRRWPPSDQFAHLVNELYDHANEP